MKHCEFGRGIANGVAVILALLSVQPVLVSAGPYDAPAGYYNSATGTGGTLKSQLHNIIDGHTIRSYSSLRDSLPVTDRDPNNPSQVILVYDRDSVTGSDGSAWNREHTWPKSRGVDSNSGPDGSDLHQIRPSNYQVNSDRGSLNFGGEYGAQSFGEVFESGQEYWYPGDDDAGMIARQQFYMAVRYDGSDSGTTDLELVDGNPGIGGTTMGNKARMIEWHYEAVPDEFELRRNDVIYDSYQFNRNPFIDRPEFVWSVFVDQQNDSQIAIGGTTPAGNGASDLDLSLGRVLVGAPAPAVQSLTLNKTGNDGTYYRVAATGLATSTKLDSYNAFRTGGTDSAMIDVGLTTDTNSAGQRQGTVTIDNLDVTTSGGVGRGANDGNDVIDITLDVLDHAKPSFAAASEMDILTHDFGTVVEGSIAPTFALDIYNLESTSGFTAGLELDEIVPFGDVTAFENDLDLFAGDGIIAPGAGMSFSTSLDTSVAGEFSVFYTLSFSDEDLPGASDVGSLQLLLKGVVEAAIVETADFDVDGDVDGADFLSWQNGLAAGTTLAEGDANDDMIVDGLDLAIWQQQHAGGLASQAIVAIPEPESLSLACLLISLCLKPSVRTLYAR